MEEPTDVQPDETPPAAPNPRNSSLWRWRGPVSLVGGILFASLGLLLVSGAQANDGDDALAGALPSELIQILDSVESENDRLEQERRRLEAELAFLTTGTVAQALEASRDRLAALEILGGTTPVRGPGVRIRIVDPEGGVEYADILDAVQELRDAGAESIDVSGSRVVVNTWFAPPAEGQAAGIVVSGELRTPPYVILAIGDPQTMATAMEIPGGVASSIRTAGGEFTVESLDEVEITSTVPLSTPEYSQPVSSP